MLVTFSLTCQLGECASAIEMQVGVFLFGSSQFINQFLSSLHVSESGLCQHQVDFAGGIAAVCMNLRPDRSRTLKDGKSFIRVLLLVACSSQIVIGNAENIVVACILRVQGMQRFCTVFPFGQHRSGRIELPGKNRAMCRSLTRCVRATVLSRGIGDRWLVNVNENKTLYRIEKTIDGFQLSIENKLPMLRMERLSLSMLICLFAGDIKTLDIHQKPEALHFGLNRSGTGARVSYMRRLKSHKGGALKGAVEIPWKSEKVHRVIAIKKLNSNIQQELKNIPPATLENAAKASVGEQSEGITKFTEEFRAAAKRATSAQFDCYAFDPNDHGDCGTTNKMEPSNYKPSAAVDSPARVQRRYDSRNRSRSPSSTG